jgi:hypothetical protein
MPVSTRSVEQVEQFINTDRLTNRLGLPLMLSSSRNAECCVKAFPNGVWEREISAIPDTTHHLWFAARVEDLIRA